MNEIKLFMRKGLFVIKEPFKLQESVMFIERWNSLNRKIVAGFSTRNGGFSKKPFDSMNLGLHVNDTREDVIRNREKLSEMIGAPLHTWICAEQIHGDKIAKVSKEDKGKGSTQMETAIKGVDGLYTRDQNTFLFSAYADCVPLYFFAISAEDIIGVAHAGWRGTAANIGGKMIEKWISDENIAVEDIVVGIGPSIGKCCYVVDDYVMEQMAKNLEGTLINKIYEKVSDGQYRLDLKAANYEMIRKSGILSEHIEISNYCTSCHSDLFFSHRKSQGKTGRMLSFIGMKDGGSGFVS
ncbi:peptidoglycan editing factor PgeF [Schinkia azotoformans]|uniref:peptidoglycan editing factor PgeF n=1 Tax=Schinkia azotoformans TaxID=1454 RepID=UPI002E2196A9|nr:peptidoglycan editing factor PgeF [Schinkia azotoformans]